VSLGLQPVTIGSDAACTIYDRRAAATALRYKLDRGQITCEDVAVGRYETVLPGDVRKVGSLEVQVHAASTRQAPASGQSPQVQAFVLSLSSGQNLQLAKGMRINSTEIPGLNSAGGDSAVAEVQVDPRDVAVLGLKNLSRENWSATKPDKTVHQMPTGRTIRLQKGIHIDFGRVTGEIRA
jgi:hypothetical protein